MEKEKNPLKNIAILNIAFASLLLIDAKVPRYSIITDKFETVASITKSTSGYKGSGAYEVIDVLYCTNSNYRIGNIPKEINSLKSGEQIKIKKTLLFGKASQIGIKEKEGTNWHGLTLLSNYYLIRLLLSAIGVSIIYLFYQKTIVDVLLSLSTVSIFFISIAYYFYY